MPKPRDVGSRRCVYASNCRRPTHTRRQSLPPVQPCVDWLHFITWDEVRAPSQSPESNGRRRADYGGMTEDPAGLKGPTASAVTEADQTGAASAMNCSQTR